MRTPCLINDKFPVGGLPFDLNFYDSAILETSAMHRTDETIGRDMLRILLMGWREDWVRLLSLDLLIAVLSNVTTI